LDNAWKYTPVGESITLSAQVIHRLTTAADDTAPEPPGSTIGELAVSTVGNRSQTELWISVSNSGVEIPAEDYERIFNQFYRIPGNNFWHQGGTGLGLTIAKKRVEKLHGSISITSQDGETTFTVKLPLHLAINALDDGF
jgi:signal transduction histidine kinase